MHLLMVHWKPLCNYFFHLCWDGENVTVFLTYLTWTEAKTICEKQQTTLATIPDEVTNSNIRKRLPHKGQGGAWIGLSVPKLWYWSDTGEDCTFTNWKSGQPNNMKGNEECSAVVVNKGTWTDEQCSATYPFYCYGSMTHWNISLVLKLQLDARSEFIAHNMECVLIQ